MRRDRFPARRCRDQPVDLSRDREQRILHAESRRRASTWQADQVRTDFAAIESDHEVIQKQLARLTTRRKLAGTALGIIFATMMPTTLRLLFLLR